MQLGSTRLVAATRLNIWSLFMLIVIDFSRLDALISRSIQSFLACSFWVDLEHLQSGWLRAHPGAAELDVNRFTFFREG